MILNARNNQFVFKFPVGFLYPEVKRKYDSYLRRMHTPFSDMESYLNHTIQSVSFPAISSNESEQILDKFPHFSREALDLERIISKEFTVNLKTTDGYLNYWVMFEQYLSYLQVSNTKDHFPDMNLIFLDRFGYQLVTVSFIKPLMKRLDSIEMSYGSNAFDFKTFGVDFKYNNFEIKVMSD